MSKHSTGDKCTECDSGRIALVSSAAEEGDLDDEPYTNHIRDGNNKTIVFKDPITLTIYACDTCGHVYDVLVG